MSAIEQVDKRMFSSVIAAPGLIQIKRCRCLPGRLEVDQPGGQSMGAYEWARQQLEQSLQDAAEQGIEPLLALRALLGEVVQRNKGLRSAADLAAELQFLADNLDDERDYAFMRP
jgi:hypothetical protein